jgi:hypothetical protein
VFALFGVSLAGLTLDRLQTFLEGAETEPLMWEAKGTELSAHEVRRQCGGMANSERGGYLILGAHWDGSAWQCDGLVFPGGEPDRYVTTCLMEGVRPIPAYDVKSFSVGDDRHVAVIEVQPLEAGPAIVRGTVYERVPGATVPVKDPTRLATLFARGERAHQRARASVDRMLAIALEPLLGLDEDGEEDDAGYADHWLFVVMAIGAVTPGPDVIAKLFSEGTRALIGQTALQLAATAPPLQPDITQFVAQDRRVGLAVAARDHEADWAVTALWDGAVGLAMRVRASFSADRIVASELRRAWAAATAIAEALSCSGDVYLAMTLVHGHALPNAVRLDRGPIALGQDPDWASIQRELSRAAGIDVSEPDPDAQEPA